MKSKIVVVLALLAGAASAQQMYRCGNTFSQQPCGPEAKEMLVPGGKKPESQEDPAARLKRMGLLTDYTPPAKAPPAPPDVPPAAEVQAAAKTMCLARVKGMLKDPESMRVDGDVSRIGTIQYFNGVSYKPAVWYLMSINAKNSFGGYTGAKPYRCYMDLSEQAIITVE